MNRQERDILKIFLERQYINQRILTDLSGYSLGVVNRSIKNLVKEGYLDNEFSLTDKSYKEFADKKPRNAIILAAGFGMRMVPINNEVPKGLLEVKGEPLIERLIKQLHEAGINKIYVVVGFMKEKYEYLIDEYGVELLVNKEYKEKNNLHSMKRALNYIGNSYIVPCDIWCKNNPFKKVEMYSWYMVNDMPDEDSNVRVNRKQELVTVKEREKGNTMIGISYLLSEEADVIKERIKKLCMDNRHDNSFWEEALYDKDKMIVEACQVDSSEIVEINTYEQLREIDNNSNQLKSDVISLISKVMNVSQNEIVDISVLKKGMTNRSFLFRCKDKRYIMRIPGEGTDKLINRKEEADVYIRLHGKGICDDIVYINPENGYKITEYLEGARVCDCDNTDDLKRCMKKLREFHKKKLFVDHEFDIFRQIDFYESLWNGDDSVYKDYKKTKEKIFSLKEYIDEYAEEKVLTHIDAVPDNFLFCGDDIRLIDWEYAGMQDPHVDIAMFCVYALYNRGQIDRLIDIYFENTCTREVRIKIYCYVAACGLLWSNWCEYKRSLGIEFGEYSLAQYRFAKDYYKIAKEELERK